MKAKRRKRDETETTKKEQQDIKRNFEREVCVK